MHADQIWACDALTGDRSVLSTARRPSSTPSLKTRKADPCRGDTLSDRCLGCAYRCEKPRPMDKHPSISFVITTGSLGLALLVWRKRARSRSSKRRFMRNAPMPSASVLPRSVRQECLDHLLILHEKQHEPRAKSRMWSTRNQARPHQGIQQQIPDSCASSSSTAHEGAKVVAVPILAGLHHDYRKVA
jgi:hypothetical protein